MVCSKKEIYGSCLAAVSFICIQKQKKFYHQTEIISIMKSELIQVHKAEMKRTVYCWGKLPNKEQSALEQAVISSKEVRLRPDEKNL